VAMLPVTTAIAVLFVREPILPPQPHLGLVGSIRAIFENELLRRVLLPDLLLGIAQGVSGGLFLFYFQSVLGFAQEAQTLLFIYFVAGLLGVPIWIWLGRKLGKHRALQAVFIYTAATTLLLLFVPPHNFVLGAACMIVAGLAQGGGVLLTRSLMADVVDSDEAATGARRSGMFFGLLLTTSKVGLATGPITYAILDAVNFQPGANTVNSADALGVLSGMFIGVPILLTLLGALSLYKYPLDEKRQAALAAAISARQAENSANTLGPSTK
jgi:GPH family glycoside/pentoside/hexuronide:cation symporter